MNRATVIILIFMLCLVLFVIMFFAFALYMKGLLNHFIANVIRARIEEEADAPEGDRD